jgi:NAD(P)-dependent dehydrogenase (short-subunit alcohol dehydrogenase family)
MELTGRVALVTGGATGIGRATVLRLARSGAAGVAINYRSARDQAAQLASEVRELGAEALCVHADVRRDEQVRAMVRQIDERFGRLDVVVNNAGITRWIPIADLEALTDEAWHEILDVNLIAAFRCTRAAAELLKQAGGAVVNVSSISGYLATATLSSLPYGASKAALMYLTKGLAVALGPHVRVNAVAPAFTDTDWMREYYGDQYEQAIARASENFPLRRIATPDDVAAAIVSLIVGGDFVTGQTLLVDGGISLS